MGRLFSLFLTNGSVLERVDTKKIFVSYDSSVSRGRPEDGWDRLVSSPCVKLTSST